MRILDRKKDLKRLQENELEILSYFDEFCKKNNLEYYIAYGTLIGAVRHKGFIPWDDDVDVFMKGEDFLKVQEIFNNKNTDKRYFLQSLESEKNYYLLWNKIRLNNTIFVEKGWEENQINNGFFIDIFPLMDYPVGKLKQKLTSIKIKVTKLLINNNIKYNLKYDTYGFFGKILSKIFKLIPQKIRNKIVIRNMKKLCEYRSNSEYYYSIEEDLKVKFKKDFFEEKILLPINEKMFYAPKKYDECLKISYGDYMKLPPEEERAGHGEVYVKFEEEKDEKEYNG